LYYCQPDDDDDDDDDDRRRHCKILRIIYLQCKPTNAPKFARITIMLQYENSYMF
jgi:hypothetical protein